MEFGPFPIIWIRITVVITMAKGGWRFRKIEDGQKAQNPTHREHLKGVVESLVREAIQNSLDATSRSAGGAPDPVTKVVFTFGSCAGPEAAPFFSGLLPHLKAVTDILPEGLPDTGNIPFLTIEDFGTRGLVGDPELFAENLPTPINGDKKNHFYHFWHAVGQSPGEHKRRGSWGVGKIVFSNASAIRSFFGLTRFEGGASPYLMGEAGLRVHEMSEASGRYDWYGYFAEHKVLSSSSAPYPVADTATISKFQRLFKLGRRENDTGLSIVVPFYRREFKPMELARFAIENYFYAIAARRLEVSVISEHQSFHLTADRLDDVVDSLEWPAKATAAKGEMRKLLGLARWHQQLGDADLLKLNASVEYAINPDHWPDDSLKQSAARFSANEPVALRVVVPVKEIGGERHEESLDLVLQRDDALRKGNVVHMRAGLTLPDLRDKSGPGVRGLLLIGADDRTESGPLEKLLQKAEGPAHRNWETSGEHYDQAKNTYEDAYHLIRFCRSLAARVRELLTTPAEARDVQTLRSFFPDPTRHKKSEDGPPPVIVEAPPEIPPLPPEPPKMFTRDEVEDGFVIRGNSEFVGQLSPLRIRMAYATWGGGQWVKYRPTDFDLGKDELAIKAVGINEAPEAMVVKPNTLVVTPIDPNFRIEVRGFDRNRALHVEVRQITAAGEDE